MTEVKWDGLEDESNSYTDMPIFCFVFALEEFVFFLEEKSPICICTEMLHS